MTYELTLDIILKYFNAKKIPNDILIDIDINLNYTPKNTFVFNYLGKELECDEEQWLFLLITSLEDIVVNKYSNYIFHGSAIFINNRTLLFVGASGSGKTTAVNILKSRVYYIRRFAYN